MHNAAAAQVLGVESEPETADSRLSLSSWSLDDVLLSEAERPTARALRGEAVHDAEIVVRVAEQSEDRVLNVSAIPLPRDEVLGRARALVLLRDTTIEHAHREELSAFAGVVAHDLRNPLAAIDGWTEMIADELDAGALDAQLAREFVSRVRSVVAADARADPRPARPRDQQRPRPRREPRRRDRAGRPRSPPRRHAEGLVTAESVPLGARRPGPGAPGARQPDRQRAQVRRSRRGAQDHGPGLPQRRPARDRRWSSTTASASPRPTASKIFDEFHRAHYREYEGSGLGPLDRAPDHQPPRRDASRHCPTRPGRARCSSSRSRRTTTDGLPPRACSVSSVRVSRSGAPWSILTKPRRPAHPPEFTGEGSECGAAGCPQILQICSTAPASAPDGPTLCVDHFGAPRRWCGRLRCTEPGDATSTGRWPEVVAALGPSLSS